MWLKHVHYLFYFFWFILTQANFSTLFPSCTSWFLERLTKLKMSSLKLHRHLKSSNGKRHGCSMCTKTFYNHTVMVVHKRSHFGELPYNCVTCGAGFRWGSQLKSHVHVIHPRKKNPQCEMFSCEQCEESFSGLPKLMEHRRQSHSGVVLTESYNLRKPIEKFGTRKIQNFNNGL